VNGYNFVSRELCKSLSWMLQFASNRAEGFVNPSSNLQEIYDEISNDKFKRRFKLNIIIITLISERFSNECCETETKLITYQLN